ncbi:hypothetical protein Tco_1323830 [Tanacetum coccineum]
MLKTRKRVWSSSDRDPAQWLSFEISRTRPKFNMKEEMLRLRDSRANTPLGVPYTEEDILVLVRKGKQRGYIPEVGRDKTIDEPKEEANQTRRELELLRRVVTSDDRMS